MIGLNKKTTYRKKNSFMNDFTKNMAQALFNQNKINDFLRKEIQTAVNQLLEAELTAMIMNGYSCRDIIKPVILKNTLKNLLDSVVGCMGIVVICLLCDLGFKSLIIKTILSVVLSIVMYGAILVLLKNKNAYSLLNRVKTAIENKYK